MSYLLLSMFITSTTAFLFMPPIARECNCPLPPPCPPVRSCPPPPSCPQPMPCTVQGLKTYQKDRPDELELRAQMLGVVDLQQSEDEQTMPPHMMIESLAEKYPLDQGPTNFVEPLTYNAVIKDDDSDLIPSNKRHNALVKRQATIDDSTTPKPTAEPESQDDQPNKKSSDDLKCNSEELRQLMLANIGETTSNSKRNINDKAEEQFGGSVDVICSKGHFSYVYSSNLYCEATKGDITCIAFRQSPP